MRSVNMLNAETAGSYLMESLFMYTDNITLSYLTIIQSSFIVGLTQRDGMVSYT